jgi:glycerophosphoryl diester phosphodiesterase
MASSMKNTLVIAHRGFHRDFPENTIEAFKAAVYLGADGVEFDVQETADGEFVIHHDDDIEGRSIGSLTLAEIAVCRAVGGYRIPTLQEALEVLGSGLVLLVELKQVRSLEKLLSLLRSHVDAAFTVVISFDATLVEKLALLAPDFPRAVIGEPVNTMHTATAAETAGFRQVRANMVTDTLVKEAHAGGGLVFVRDGGEDEDLRRALRCGIDVVMTDRPDVAIRQIRGL